MSFQEIVVYLLLGIAVAFLVKKFFGKKKKDNDCGDGNCGCG
nr:FeoB-associated Cys-rich membrane protein [Flavobacterium saliperosum]